MDYDEQYRVYWALRTEAERVAQAIIDAKAAADAAAAEAAAAEIETYATALWPNLY